jgi:hypothetical protein
MRIIDISNTRAIDRLPVVRRRSDGKSARAETVRASSGACTKSLAVTVLKRSDGRIVSAVPPLQV